MLACLLVCTHVFLPEMSTCVDNNFSWTDLLFFLVFAHSWLLLWHFCIFRAAALSMAALAVLTVVPICAHSIPGYTLELFSLPMSSSLFALFSLPGLPFMFACLLACIAEGTYAGLYSWVPMVHGPRVLIQRICVNNERAWKLRALRYAFLP